MVEARKAKELELEERKNITEAMVTIRDFGSANDMENRGRGSCWWVLLRLRLTRLTARGSDVKWAPKRPTICDLVFIANKDSFSVSIS